MISFNILACIVSLLLVGAILILVRRQRLGVIHTFWWLIIAAGIMVFGLYPALSDRLAGILGVGYPPVLPIVGALCLVFVKILTTDMEQTRQEGKIRILAQKMAAYEAEIRSLKRKLAEEQGVKEK